MLKLRGIISSLVTPFDEKENINENEFRKLISMQISQGAHGIGVAPNTGEFINLTFADIQKLIEISVDEVRKRVPLVIGALSPAMRCNMEIASYAKQKGADAILLTPPYYISPSEEGLFEYFKYIGKVGIPFLIFNHPLRTPYNIQSAMIERLLRIDTFVGIKDADPSFTNITKKINFCGDRLSYLIAKDDYAFHHFLMNGHGGFLALANIALKLLLDIYNNIRNNKIEKAKEIQLKVIELCDAVYVENYPSALKEGLKLLGCNPGNPRTPIHVISGAKKEALYVAMKNAKIL
jgi:4-hydroxy-tetrahydrodipicolinate synthase